MSSLTCIPLRRRLFGLLLLTLVLCASAASAETVSVRLSIWNDRLDEKVITNANLLKIKEFMLKEGKRETYCQMYNQNPAYHTKKFSFFLNPDTSQQNINCDPAKSDFHDLTIRRQGRGGLEYGNVDFFGKNYVVITLSSPEDDLTVGQIRETVTAALNEILAAIDKPTLKKTDAGTKAAKQSLSPPRGKPKAREFPQPWVVSGRPRPDTTECRH